MSSKEIGVGGTLDPAPEAADGEILGDIPVDSKSTIPERLTFTNADRTLTALVNFKGVLEWDVASRTKLRELSRNAAWGRAVISPRANRVMYRWKGAKLGFLDLETGKPLGDDAEVFETVKAEPPPQAKTPAPQVAADAAAGKRRP